ncbi:hypothetical protein CYMTET_56159 [Cymbomonas tetramitiformis]|uniref:Zinc finger PHD-type domain-containing protein n=1 Tax=Cymbomonas tetramitiformis TaxID=36881 RepID=A0AAE0BD87_9CHLO|nr:hypothetical protein CYMTET_56159 [Cymbomonas tetramitiformis]
MPKTARHSVTEPEVSLTTNKDGAGVKYVMHELRESNEMDIHTDLTDLLVMNADGSRLFTQGRAGQAQQALVRGDYSVRSYLEVLYMGSPSVNIYLRERRVIPRDPYALLTDQVQRFRLEVSVPAPSKGAPSTDQSTTYVAQLSLGYTNDATAAHLMRLSYTRFGCQLFNANVGKDVLGILTADFLTMNRSKTGYCHNILYVRLTEAIKDAMQRYYYHMQTKKTAGVTAELRRIPLHPGEEVIRPGRRDSCATGKGVMLSQASGSRMPEEQDVARRGCDRPRGDLFEGVQAAAGDAPEQQEPVKRKRGRPRKPASLNATIPNLGMEAPVMRDERIIQALYNGGQDADCEVILSHDPSTGKYVTHCKDWGEAVVWCTCGLPSIGSMIQCSICNHWEHAMCAGYDQRAPAIYACHVCCKERGIQEAEFVPRPLHRQKTQLERVLVLSIQHAMGYLTKHDAQLSSFEQQLLDSRTFQDICDRLVALEGLLPAAVKPVRWDERHAVVWRAAVQRAESPHGLWEVAVNLLHERTVLLPIPWASESASDASLSDTTPASTSSALAQPAVSTRAHDPSFSHAHAQAPVYASAPSPAHASVTASTSAVAHACTPNPPCAPSPAHALSPAAPAANVTQGQGDGKRTSAAAAAAVTEAQGWHLVCLTPPLARPPEGDWECPRCLPAAPEPVSGPSPQEFVNQRVQFTGEAGELLRGAPALCLAFVKAGMLQASEEMLVVKLDLGVQFLDGITDTIIGVRDKGLLAMAGRRYCRAGAEGGWTWGAAESASGVHDE